MTSSVHRQEVLLESLPTRSVTFYPSRALISREIPDVELKPGANEIEIYGLTPTTDEHSIKVDGFGAASVTDMTIDLVPNRETFAQVYPDDMDYEDSESEFEDDEEEAGPGEVKDCLTYIKETKRKLDRERMVLTDLQNRINYLHTWYSGLQGKDVIGNKVPDLLNTFHDANTKLNDELKASRDRTDQLRKDESSAQKKLRNLTQDKRRKERKESIEKAKKTLRERSAKESARKERQRVREERAKYFPKKVYKVTIHLDVPVETPGTSRRSSVSSVTIIKNQESGDGDVQDAVTSTRANLQLSYITLDASWAPRYDIEFATQQKTGKITYRAEFTNRTSETWAQTKVSLSTSQASFRGLEDQVPWLRWWRIGLIKTNTGSGALTSIDERTTQSQGPSQAYQPSSEHRSELFGIDQESASYQRDVSREVQKQRMSSEPSRQMAQTAYSSHARITAQSMQGQSQTPTTASTGFGLLQASQAQSGSGLFGRSNGQVPGNVSGQPRLFGGRHRTQVEGPFGVRGNTVSDLFGQPTSVTAGFSGSTTAITSALPFSQFQALREHGSAQDADDASDSMPQSRATRSKKVGHSSHGVLEDGEEKEEEDEAMGSGLFDGPAHPRVDFEDTTWEDHGLTTTYDIPNSRTIEPSSLTRRHKIASLPFSNLVLTSISVPKLRQAAFLRARFRNPSSSITLLKGTAGLTLDGTFLGNTTLPRVSPGELITLPLGVDPALHVSYARPVVKRSTHGVFNKESAQVFTRSIVVTNTKSVAAELLVLDQVPISEDERLRVEIIEPRGLIGEGAIVSTGVNAQAGKGKWGSAKATLKKNGEIAFNVLLEKGAAARLAVDYDARAPTTDTITSK